MSIESPLTSTEYDVECSQLLQANDALGAAVLIVGGSRGNGFSVQGTFVGRMALADALELAAKELRESLDQQNERTLKRMTDSLGDGTHGDVQA